MTKKKPTGTELKSQRDEKGRFLKNNKIAKKDFSITAIEKRELKNVTRAEVIRCAASLTRPWNTLKDDLKNPDASRLEYLTAQAISNRHYKFVQWLVEMTIGKAVQNVETHENSQGKKEIVLKYNLN